MARDYKYRTTARRRRKTSPWAWLATGLAIGLFTTLLVFLKYRAPDPANVSKSVEQNTPSLKTANTDNDHKLDKKKNLAPKTPRFDFYKKLPEMEIIIPETKISGDKKNGIKQIATPGTYLLQAGSFRSYEQADKLRAKLAFQGLETKMQSTDEKGDQWHRVRVGPFDDLSQLNKTRSELKETGIDAIVIRLKSK